VDMTTMAIDPPLHVQHVLSDVLGRSMVFDPPLGYGFEALMRPLIDTLGSLVSYSTAPLAVDVIRQRALPGTLSFCLQIGRVFAEFAGSSETEVSEQLARIGGVLLAAGAIVERIA